MSLGDYVKITRIFLEAFKDANEEILEENSELHSAALKVVQLQADLKVCEPSTSS